MSSRVVNRSDASSVSPIVWGRQHAPPSSSAAPANGRPADQANEIADLKEKIAAAQQRQEAEVSAAYQRGYRDGESQVKAGLATEMHAVVQRMCQAIADLSELRPRLRREAESDVVQLSLAIARRVLRREMSIDPAAMHALVHVALQKLQRQEASRVYVHPNQAAAVKTALEAAGSRVEVIAEMTRPQGTLIFETNQGNLDASINAQLEEIDRGLTDRVNQS